MIEVSPERSKLQERLLALIRTNGAYDSNRNWVYMNRLWYESSARHEYAEILTAYLRSVTNWSSEKILLCLDGIISYYGILPVIGEAADKLGCELAIWREIGQITLTESLIVPSLLPQGSSCVIVQDVVSRGSTILKLIDDLKRVKWTVSHFVCLVNKNDDSVRLDASLADFRKERSVCIDDFKFDFLVDGNQLSNGL